jgi:hypothetical protein
VAEEADAALEEEGEEEEGQSPLSRTSKSCYLCKAAAILSTGRQSISEMMNQLQMNHLPLQG